MTRLNHQSLIDAPNMKNQAADPTFLVIGAQKCGTTWLAKMISQHPEVSVSAQKELHFFNKVYNYNKGLEWYKSQFNSAPTAKAIGELTPNYFWTSEDEKEVNESFGTRNIPKLVHDAYPDLQLIVCLRNPVDRAISAYYHHIRNGRIKPKQRITDVAECYGIESMGYYDDHLSNWMKYFSFENFLFVIYEDDIQDEKKKATLKKVFKHIGVNDDFEPSGLFSRYNYQNSHFDMRTGHYPSIIRDMIRRITPTRIAMSKIWRLTVKEEDREALGKKFKSHNENIEEMIGRRLVNHTWL